MTPKVCQTEDVINEEETGHQEKNESPRETDTIIVMPESEKKGRKGIFLMVAGGLIFFISVLIQQTIYENWWQEAVPVYAMITGVHISFLGVFQAIQTQEQISFELAINGKQIVSFIPLRAIILASINLFFSAFGIIFMSVMGVSWNDEILCLTISILIGIGTILHLFASLLSSKYQNFKFPTSMSSFPGPDGLNNNLQNLVTNMAATIISMFPEFPKANLTETLQLFRSVLHKDVHHTLIVLSMLLASVIFAAQLVDMAMSPRNQNNEAMSDPKCTYALNQLPFLDSSSSSTTSELSLPFLDSAFSSSHTKLWVLISAPVTVFLSIPLFFLTNKPSMLNIILAFIISGSMAVLLCFQSVATISWMILMGSSVPPLTFNLRLGITMGSTILASLFLSIAFFYLNTCINNKKYKDEKTSSNKEPSSEEEKTSSTKEPSFEEEKTSSSKQSSSQIDKTSSTKEPSSEEEKTSSTKESSSEEEKTSSTKEPSSVPVLVVAVLTFIVSAGAFASNIGWLTEAMQSYWNSDCDYIKAESYQIMIDFLSFCLVQSVLSITLFTLSLLLILTGNRISPSILLFIGIISFASSIRNLIFYLTGFFDFANVIPIIYYFHICNGLQMALGIIFGCSLSFEGRSFLVTIFSILSRTIIITLALNSLLVFSLVMGIIKLANLSVNIASKEKKELKQDKLNSKYETRRIIPM